MLRIPQAGFGRRAVVGGALALLLCQAVSAGNEALERKVREAFVQAWEARGALEAERDAVAVRLYREVWLGPPVYSDFAPWPQTVPDDATAEEIIAGRYGEIGAAFLWQKTDDMCLDFFLERHKAILPALAAEIREDKDGRSRPFSTLGAMVRHLYRKGGRGKAEGPVSLDEASQRRYQAIVEAMFPVLAEQFRLSAGGDEGRAYMLAQALRDLGDPRAIPLLLGDVPEKNLIRYFELLRNLQRNRKAAPSLVGLLSSKDTEVRWRAAYALAESRDPDLLAPALELLRDPGPRVREQALYIAYFLPEERRAAAYEGMKALLADPDLQVRLTCATLFAERKDPACAQAILGLLKDEAVGANLRGHAAVAMAELAGNDFGYDFGSDASTDKNRAAIAGFEEWMHEHAQAGE